MNEANAPFYLTTPELTTIDGQHILKFKAEPITPGEVKIQIGTLDDADNYSSFIAHGSEIIIDGGTEQEYTSIAIPANVDYKYVTLRITPTSVHQSISLDDFIWESEPTAIHTKSKNQPVKLYPNPVKNGILTIEAEEIIEEAVILDATGKRVKSISPASQKATLNY